MRKLVTFGIVPTAAETGYGYIKRGSSEGESAFIVDEFVEKPALELAEQYVACVGGIIRTVAVLCLKRACL